MTELTDGHDSTPPEHGNPTITYPIHTWDGDDAGAHELCFELALVPTARQGGKRSGQKDATTETRLPRARASTQAVADWVSFLTGSGGAITGWTLDEHGRRWVTVGNTWYRTAEDCERVWPHQHTWSRPLSPRRGRMAVKTVGPLIPRGWRYETRTGRIAHIDPDVEPTDV